MATKIKISLEKRRHVNMKLFYLVTSVVCFIFSNSIVANDADGDKQIAQLIRDQVTCAAFYLANDNKEEIKHLKSLKKRAVRWSKILFYQGQVKAEKYIDKRVAENATKYSTAYRNKKRTKDFSQPCLTLNPDYKDHMVTVKPLLEEASSIPFESMETVYLLKLKIEAKYRIKPKNQNLIFSGKKLDDTKTLGSYSIKANDEIQLKQTYNF